MSWLFGAPEPKKKEDSLQETLGFDPLTLTDILPASGLFDASRLHPLAGLDKGIEYLDLEDELVSQMEGSQGLIPSRGWTDDLCYGTGTVYVLALGLGGLYGIQEGVNKIPANASGKLKLNTVLNSVTRRGPFLGNSAAVLAMTYNIINSSIDLFRGKHDSLNSITAGALAGAIFKSSSGLRPMGISTALMATGAAAWCGFKKLVM